MDQLSVSRCSLPITFHLAVPAVLTFLCSTSSLSFVLSLSFLLLCAVPAVHRPRSDYWSKVLIFSYQMSVSLLVVYQKQNATTAAISTDEVVVLSVTVFMGDFFSPFPIFFSKWSDRESKIVWSFVFGLSVGLYSVFCVLAVKKPVDNISFCFFSPPPAPSLSAFCWEGVHQHLKQGNAICGSYLTRWIIFSWECDMFTWSLACCFLLTWHMVSLCTDQHQSLLLLVFTHMTNGESVYWLAQVPFVVGFWLAWQVVCVVSSTSPVYWVFTLMTNGEWVYWSAQVPFVGGFLLTRQMVSV